jgi:hypothetical protein
MIYFKHKDIDLYSKFNEETGELVHMSAIGQDCSASLQTIEAEQRDFLKSELELIADSIEESAYLQAADSIKAKIAQL